MRTGRGEDMGGLVDRVEVTLRGAPVRGQRQSVGNARRGSRGDRTDADLAPQAGAQAQRPPSRSQTSPRPAAHSPESPSRRAAVEVLLLLADTDAGWGDYESALDLLDCAASVLGELPDDYELKRSRWMRLLDEGQDERLAA